MAAVRSAVAYGIRLQEPQFDLANIYRTLGTITAVANHLTEQNLPSWFGGGQAVLLGAVRFALLGNDNASFGETYVGAMSKEEYAEFAKKSQKRNGKTLGDNNKTKCRGIFTLNSEALRGAAISSAISRGEKPWGDEEVVCVFLSTLDSSYRTGTRIDNRGIAELVNRHYHNERDASSVSNLLFRERRSAKKVRTI